MRTIQDQTAGLVLSVPAISIRPDLMRAARNDLSKLIDESRKTKANLVALKLFSGYIFER